MYEKYDYGATTIVGTLFDVAHKMDMDSDTWDRREILKIDKNKGDTLTYTILWREDRQYSEPRTN